MSRSYVKVQARVKVKAIGQVASVFALGLLTVVVCGSVW